MYETRLQSQSRRWPFRAFNLTVWTLMGLLRATQVAPGFEMMGHASSWWRVAIWQLLVFHVWVALTPVIIWLGRRFKPEQSHWVGTLATHVLLGSAVTLFYLFIYSY